MNFLEFSSQRIPVFIWIYSNSHRDSIILAIAHRFPSNDLNVSAATLTQPQVFFSTLLMLIKLPQS